LFGDLNRFLLIRDRKIEITADCFLRFGKRPVSDHALFSGNNFAFVFQRIAADTFPSAFNRSNQASMSDTTF
jgi:hypothetical protein